MAGETCSSCSRSLTADAKFCAQCGHPTATNHGGLTLLELDSRSRAPGTVSEGQVTRGSPLRLLTATAAALLAVLVLLVVVAQSDSDDPAGEDETAEDDNPSASDNSEAATGDGQDSTEGDKPSDGGAIESATDGEIELMSMLGDQQLVAVGRGRMLLVNPDNDQVVEYSLGGTPVGVVDRELVLFRPAEGFVAVDLDDPEASTRSIVSLDELAAVETDAAVQLPVNAVLRVDNTLLIEYVFSPLGSIDSQSIAYVVDVESGQLQRSSLDVGRPSWWFGHGRLGLAWVPDAGLFDGLDGPTRKISDGFPLLFAADYVITYQCAEPGECTVSWLDRHTGETVDRTLPAFEDMWWRLSEVGRGGWLLLLEGADRPRYFDVSRNRWLPDEVDPPRAGLAESGRFDGRSETVSSDGRLLAIPDGSQLILHDMDSEITEKFTVAGLTRGQRLFFVET